MEFNYFAHYAGSLVINIVENPFEMKSLSTDESFSYKFVNIVVVEGTDNSSSSSDDYGRGDGNDSDDLASNFVEYAVENLPQMICAPGLAVGGKVPQPFKTNEEYHRRRERNNLAVRKSRDKAKQKQKESLHRLQELTVENKRLQMKAELLMKELVVLKGLFPTIGETPPPEIEEFLAE